MCNPTSLANRDLHPKESQPAEVLDYKLHFFGSSGMADAVPAKGESFHGVLHKMPASDQEKLNKIEFSYLPKIGKVRLYDGTEKDALVYELDPAKV